MRYISVFIDLKRLNVRISICCVLHY